MELHGISTFYQIHTYIERALNLHKFMELIGTLPSEHIKNHDFGFRVTYILLKEEVEGDSNQRK